MHLSNWQNTLENTAKRNEWNTLDPEIRNAPSVTAFKHKLILKIRPFERSIYSIPDPIGVPYLSQIRVRLSKLNLHKFKHNFKDTINPFCPANDGVENAGHFFLFYPSCYNYQRDLTRISVVLRPFVQTKFYCYFYCIVIKVFLVMLINMYSNLLWSSFTKRSF